jgi:Ca2+-binding RTX toxin-like protein
MPLDIAALQYLYGAAPTNTGNTSYDLSTAEFQGFNAIWDAGGNDTLDASHLAHAVTLDLHQGATSDIGATINAMAKTASGVTLNTAYTSTLSIASGAIIENAVGSAFNDRITGNDFANFIAGGAGSDRLEGRGGDDLLDGGTGIDTAVVDGARASYGIGKSGASYQVWGPTGLDTLTNVERVAFTDAKIALDLDGNAGMAAKLLGVVLGASYVHDASTMGIVIGALDAGASAEAVLHAGLELRLGHAPTNEAVVALLLTNLTDAPAWPQAVATYADVLDSGAYTQTSLAMAAANHQINMDHIGLVGLAASGVEYI